MADTKISALPAGTITASTVIPVVNGAVTQRAPVQAILNLVGTIEGPPGLDGADGLPGESVTVFEQPTTPVAFRTGDIWLEPTTLSGVAKDGLTLQEVEAVVDGRLSKLPPPSGSGLSTPEVLDLIDAAIAKLPQPEPPKLDLGWIPLTGVVSFGISVNGFARELNGVVYLRGTYRADFGFLPAQRIAGLPSGIPRPAFDFTVLVYGNSTGSTVALPGKLTIKTNGDLVLDAPDCNVVLFDGVTIPVK